MSTLLAPVVIARHLEDASIKVLLYLDCQANSALVALNSLPACVTDVVVTGAEDSLQARDPQLPDLQGVTRHTCLAMTGDASPVFQQEDLPPGHIALIQYMGGTTGPAKGKLLTLRGTCTT